MTDFKDDGKKKIDPMDKLFQEIVGRKVPIVPDQEEDLTIPFRELLKVMQEDGSTATDSDIAKVKQMIINLSHPETLETKDYLSMLAELLLIIQRQGNDIMEEYGSDEEEESPCDDCEEEDCNDCEYATEDPNFKEIEKIIQSLSDAKSGIAQMESTGILGEFTQYPVKHICDLFLTGEKENEVVIVSTEDAEKGHALSYTLTAALASVLADECPEYDEDDYFTTILFVRELTHKAAKFGPGFFEEVLKLTKKEEKKDE